MTLRNLSLISLLVLFCLSGQAQQNKSRPAGIRFTNLTWAVALQQAAQLNKVIFVDAYASWCGPCKEMAAHTFTNTVVAAYFNTNYVNVSLDMEKGDGLPFAEKYAIVSYPTVLFISPQGKVLAKWEGFLDDKELLGLARKLNNTKE